MKTITEIRKAFWSAHPEFKQEFRARKRQNDYRTDVRVAFVEYTDSLARTNIITNKLAHRATL